jgi:hypothetical protein
MTTIGPCRLMAFAQILKRLKLFLQVSTGQFTVKEFESSEQKIIAIGSLIPHYMQWIRKDITDSKDRHKSSFFQTRNEIAGSVRTRNPRWRESGLVLCMGQASKPIKSRPSQAEGPQPGESLLISSHRKLHTERASLGHSNIQNEECQANLRNAYTNWKILG